MKSAVDSNTVLWGQTIIYTAYVLAIMALMAWFAYNIVRTGPSKIKPKRCLRFRCILGDYWRLVTYHHLQYNSVDES